MSKENTNPAPEQDPTIPPPSPRKKLSQHAARMRADRIRRDRAAYQPLLDYVITHQCGIKAACDGTGYSRKLVQRLFEKGIPEDELRPVRVLAAAAATRATVGKQTVQETRQAVKQEAKLAAQEAALDIRSQLRAAAKDVAAAEAALYTASAKAITEEAQLVDQTRRTAAVMLGRLIKIMRAAEPMIERLEVLVADTEELDFDSGLKQLSALMKLSQQITDVGDKAMALRRRLLGDPERILAVHNDGPDFESDEEALASLDLLTTQLTEARNHGLKLLPGGKGEEKAG
jgi:hypothetical protein